MLARVAVVVLALLISPATYAQDELKKTAALTTFQASDIKGTWRVYILSSNGTAQVSKICTIKVQTNGDIKNTTTCRLKDAFTGQETINGPVFGGNLKVSKTGRVSGRILTGTGLGKDTITQAWMTRAKDAFHGIGEFNGTWITQISAVRR